MSDPRPAETSASSPTGKTQPPPRSESSVAVVKQPLSSGIGPAKTELPHLPPSNYDIPRRSRDDPLVIGHKKYELSLRLEGKLGFAKSRANSLNPEVSLPINHDHYREGIVKVLEHVLIDMARNKKDLSDADISARHEVVAKNLTEGILVMTYLKLRAINIFRPTEKAKFASKPRVPESFEVPEPFGYAISQLGVVEVSSLPKRMICYPTATQEAAATYLLDRKADWSQTAYAEAVRYAKDLGMTFTTVNLNLKVGSAWWLYAPKVEDEIFSLRCILPEDNYTLAGAVIYMLFVNDAAAGPASELFNLSSLEDADYGSFIRGPREQFNLASYYAISKDGSETLWKSSA